MSTMMALLVPNSIEPKDVVAVGGFIWQVCSPKSCIDELKGFIGNKCIGLATCLK